MKLGIPATVQRLPVIALLALIIFSLTACSGGGQDIELRKNEISGVVLAPAVSSASLAGTSLFARVLGFFFPATIADIAGLSPLPNIQVELVRLDSQGNVSSVLQTTTANSLGVYTFTTTLQPDSTLAVRIQNPQLTYNYALVNSTSDIDITPVSDAVYDTITQEIGASAGSVILEDFTVNESAALVSLIDGLNIDVSSALTLDDAVTLVTTAAGATLPSMTTNFAAASQSTTLNGKSFYIISADTTLHDSFVLGAGNGGIGTAFDRGYAAFATTPAITGNSFYDPLFHNLSTVASTMDQYLNRTNMNYVVNGKDQLVVVNPGSATTVGFTLDNGTLLSYPAALSSATAGEMYGHGVEILVGNGWGDATIAQIQTAWGNTIQNNDKKDANILNGTYNLVQLDNRLASLESLTAANQAAMQIRYGTVSFTPDTGRTFGTLATSGSLTTSQVSLDIDSYAVSNTSGSDSYGGLYTIGGSGYLTIDDTRTGYTFLQGNMAFNRPVAFLTAGKDIYAAEIDDVLDNASDAAGDTLSVNSIDTTGTTGTVVLNSDNSISYTPLASAIGTDSFNYTVSDGSLTSTAATVTINLNSGNAAPVATADSFNVNTGTSNVTLKVLANDSDAVGDTLTINSIDTTGTTGSVAVNADNKTIDYTPAGAGADSFTYTVSDGTSVSSPATVSITVAANAAPTAAADSFNVNTGASNVTLKVLANDSDAVGDTMAITNVTTPTYGSVVNYGNTISYTPDILNSSPDSFTYTAFDGTNTSAPATVTITIAANAAPTANPVSYSINNDNEGRRSLAVIVQQPAASMGNSNVSGTYSVVEYSNGFDSSGTVDSSTRQGTLVFDGLGAITGGTLHRRHTTMDIPTAKTAASASVTDQPAAATPDSPTVGSVYTVNTDGTINMTLILGTETITGHGAVTADGQLISLVLETNTIGISGSRGIMLLSRQP